MCYNSIKKSNWQTLISEIHLAINHGETNGLSRWVESDFSLGSEKTENIKAMFDILEGDIVIMQETKIQQKDLRDDMVLVPGWDVYFSLPKHKKGIYLLIVFYYVVLTI